MEIFEKGMLNTQNILKKVKQKRLVYRYTILILAQLISAAYFNLLQLPSQIVTGGSSGISIILNYYFGLDPSTVILVICVGLLLLSLIFLGFEQTTGGIAVAFLYPIFVKLTANIGTYISVDISDKILLAIFIGVFSGITTGMVYKVGFSNGGISIISEIIAKYGKMSISTVSFLISMAIVIVGGASFGWNMVMYAAIALYIYSIVLDKVLIGVSKNKALYIITSKEDDIREYIMHSLHHGVTIFDVKGGFFEKRRRVLMTVIPNRDYYRLKEGIKEIDTDAFFIVTDSYQVYGGE